MGDSKFYCLCVAMGLYCLDEKWIKPQKFANTFVKIKSHQKDSERRKRSTNQNKRTRQNVSIIKPFEFVRPKTPLPDSLNFKETTIFYKGYICFCVTNDY